MEIDDRIDLTDNEDDEAWLDIFRNGEDKESVRLVDPSRIKTVMSVYKKIKKYFGNRAKVTCTLFDPIETIGYISIVAPQIVFKDTSYINFAAGSADNISAYPKTDGTVQMNITYYGVTKSVYDMGGRDI